MSFVARAFRSSVFNVAAARQCTSIRSTRFYSAEAEAEVADVKASPEIEEIVEKISKLNVLQVADLTAVLKKRLNIADAPMMAAAAPMTAGGAPAAEAEAAAPKEEQTEFTVKLTGIDDKQKVKLIREVKNHVDGMNLVQAKKFVEGVPQTLKEGISKADAEALKKAIEAVGGTVAIE